MNLQGSHRIKMVPDHISEIRYSQGRGREVLRRPIRWPRTAFRSDGGYNHNYNIDSFGNMLLQDNLHTPQNYSIDQATNRLLLNATDLQYNAGGELVSAPNPLGGSHSMAYTAEGYLDSIDSWHTGSYLYNALGERTTASRSSNASWNEYVYLNGQPMADVDNTGKWSDYIYANGQKIAKVDSTNTRVHLTAVNQTGGWAYGQLPVPASTTVQPGDVLSFRMYQHNANGYIGLGFTDGSNTDWYCGPCYDPTGGVSDQWVNVAIPFGGTVSSPGPMAGKTFSYFFVGQRPGGPNGEYDIMYEDIALIHPDGSVVPFPVPLGNVIFGGNSPYSTNESGKNEVVSTASGAIGAVADTHYYLDDHLGTTQMELSAGGWPVWEGQFTPFGQEIIGGATTNTLGQQPADGTSMRYKFTGKERDAESGLDYFGARYYGSSMGRWMSPDWKSKPEPVPYASLDNPQTFNLYSYVGNNPLSKADADGHCSSPSVGKGQVGICIDYYISTKTVDPKGMGSHGLGDNRGPMANDTEGRYRVEVKLVIDRESGKVTGTSQAGMSQAKVLGVTLNFPGKDSTGLSASTDKNGNIHLDVTSIGINGAQVAGVPGAPPGAIQGDVRLVVTPDNQVGTDAGGSRTAYPALEVYSYQQGKDPVQVLDMPQSSDSKDLTRGMTQPIPQKDPQ
jgi:RHS repeat-associated protein